MDSKHVTDALSALIDDQLPPAERDVVETHLRSCAACAETYEKLKQQRVLLQSEPLLTPPENFYSGVLQRIETPPARSWTFPVAAAASACVVLLVVVVTHHSNNKVATRQDFLSVAQESQDASPAASSVGSVMNGPVASYGKKKDMRDEQRLVREKEVANIGDGASLHGTLKTMSAPVPARKPAPPQWKGNDSAIAQPRNVLIRTPEEWKALWVEHAPAPIDKTVVPEVDFSKYSVVGVFVGNRPAGAHVDITHLIFGHDAVRIAYRVIIPPVTAQLQQNYATQPFEFRVIPKTDLPVLFTEEQKN